MEEMVYIEQPVEKTRKRVCLTLDLKKDPELIKQYKHYHKAENCWEEIVAGISKSGIEVMDIYNVDDRMFMICEVDAETNFDEAWEKMGTYPRQGEWAELMATFQHAIPGHQLEWVRMEQVFSLKESLAAKGIVKE